MESTPSKARYVVTAFAVSLAVITYIDRVGISVALPLIRDELKLSPQDKQKLFYDNARRILGLRDPAQPKAVRELAPAK